jgi:large subunit ribosomal protein L24
MSAIKKNDKVKVLSGKEAGRQGKVIKIFTDKGRALVERVNMVKRHTKPGGKVGQQGGIIEKEAPLNLAKLMLVCPKCSKPARVGIRQLESGERVRFCKKCSEQIDG